MTIVVAARRPRCCPRCRRRTPRRGRSSRAGWAARRRSPRRRTRAAFQRQCHASAHCAHGPPWIQTIAGRRPLAPAGFTRKLCTGQPAAAGGRERLDVGQRRALVRAEAPRAARASSGFAPARRSQRNGSGGCVKRWRSPAIASLPGISASCSWLPPDSGEVTRSTAPVSVDTRNTGTAPASSAVTISARPTRSQLHGVGNRSQPAVSARPSPLATSKSQSSTAPNRSTERTWRMQASRRPSGEKRGAASVAAAGLAERARGAAVERDQSQRAVLEPELAVARDGDRREAAVARDVEVGLAVLAVGVRGQVAALATLLGVGHEVRGGGGDPRVPVAHWHRAVVQVRRPVLLAVGRRLALLVVRHAGQHRRDTHERVAFRREAERRDSERLVRERPRLAAAVRRQDPHLRALVVAVLGLAVARVAVRQEAERAVAPERRRAVVRRSARELQRRLRGISEIHPPQVVHELRAVGVEPRDRDRRPRRRPARRRGRRRGRAGRADPRRARSRAVLAHFLSRGGPM